MSEGQVGGVVKAIIVNENGEYQFQDVDLSSLNFNSGSGSGEIILDAGAIEANAGVAGEVEVVSLDDYERRHRAALLQQRGNSTCTTQSIVKPLVSSLPTSPVPGSSVAGTSAQTVVVTSTTTSAIRSMPTLLRNSRVLRQSSFGAPVISVSGTLPHQIPDVIGIGSTSAAAAPSTIEYVDFVEGGDIKFLPGSQQVFIYSDGGECSVIPEDQLQICIQQDGQVFSGGEIVQVVTADQEDSRTFEDEKTTTVQYIFQDAVDQPQPSSEQLLVGKIEQEPESLLPTSTIPTGIGEGTLVEDEEGNVYEVEHVVTETPEQEAARSRIAKTKRKQTKREAARKVVKIPGYPNMVATIRKKGAGKGLKCQELDCYYEGGNITDLKNHLRRCHDMEFDEEVICFKDYKDFKLWREVYEKERMVSFIFRGGTKKVSKDLAVTYLICHRSGHYKPTTQDQMRKRRLKPQGSCKMNGHCTAGIKLLKNTENGEVRMEICHTHYGHPLDSEAIQHLRANNVLKKIIWKKFQEGMTFSKVVEYLHHNPEQIEGIRLLDKRAIRNLYDKFKKNQGNTAFGEDFGDTESENSTEVAESEKVLEVPIDADETEPEQEPSSKPEKDAQVLSSSQEIAGGIVTEAQSSPGATDRPDKSHSSFAEVAKLVLVKPANQSESEPELQGSSDPEVQYQPASSSRSLRGLRREATPAPEVQGAKKAKLDEEHLSQTETSKPTEVDSKETDELPRLRRGRPPKLVAVAPKPADLTSRRNSKPAETASGADDTTQLRRSGRERKPKLFDDDEIPPSKANLIDSVHKREQQDTKRRKKTAPNLKVATSQSEESLTSPPKLERITDIEAGTSEDHPPPVLQAETSNYEMSPESLPSSKLERRKTHSVRFNEEEDTSNVVVGDTLQQTINNLLKQSESGPTVLLYKKPNSLEPTYGSHSELRKDDFVLIIQSPVQRQLLQQFPDVINVDAHVGKNKDLKLAWIMILDEYREAIPVAWLICSSVEDRILRIFFELILSECGQLQTEYIIAPVNRDYHGIWSSVFSSNPRMLLNEEDTKRDLRVEIADYFTKVEVRRALDEFVSNMMYATRKEVFNKALGNMREYLSKIDSGMEFYQHFERTWKPRAEQWSLFGCIDKAVNTLFVSESFGKVKKFISFKGTRMLNSNIDPILKTSYDKCFARTKRLYKGDQKIQNHMAEIQSHHDAGCLLPPESFAGSPYPNHYLVNDGAKNLAYTVLDLKSPCRCRFVCSDCNVCIHKYMCSCVTSCVNHQMCQHIHFVHTILSGTTEEVEGQIISGDILPEGYEVRNSSGDLEQYTVADALGAEAGQSGTVVTVVQLGPDQEVLAVT